MGEGAATKTEVSKPVRPKVKRKSILIGTDPATNQPTYLDLKWLQQKNLHVLGPPGEGKSRFLLNLFEALCWVPGASIILINPKGSLGRMARDYVLSHGLTKRLVWLDPGDEDATLGYNPLLPNSMAVAAHAKAVREAIRAAWGQANLDATPQLARLLFLSLGVCRALHLTLSDAVQLLRSGAAGAPLRRKLIPALGIHQDHRFFHQALAWFDSLSERRQEELSASTLARLEAFVSDPVIAAMLTASRTLHIQDVIKGHKILIVNTEIRRPLSLDDVRLFDRLIINDIVSQQFADATADTYLIGDECHQFLTSDLCQALDMGRELRLHTILAHQNLDQLRQEDESGRVYGAVMKCARVKVLFGDLAADDLDVLLRDAMIDQFDPMRVKDELTNLELDPHEATREVETNGVSVGGSFGLSRGSSSAVARGRSRGFSRQVGASHSHSDAFSMVHSSATSSGMSMGETLLPNGDMMSMEHTIDGSSEADASGTTTTDTYGEFQSEGSQYGSSKTKIDGTQVGANLGINANVNRTTSRVPFYEYVKRRIVSSRTFETEQEFLTKCLQKVKALPRGHFLLKLPKRPAMFLCAPFVRDPQITERRRTANLERVYDQPCYERRSKPLGITAAPAYQLPAPAVESDQPSAEADSSEPEDWGS